jgi:cytochrome c-type biogenesis protein CcmH/NrfG
MKRDNFVFLISGVFFGVLVGWMLGSQQGGRFTPGAATATSAPVPGQMTGAATGAPQQQATTPPPPPINEAKVADLTKAANADPRNVSARTELGNLYFDSERFDLAIPWYEAAFKLTPNDPNLSTDLGVSYLYTDKTDQAIAQFEKSVAADPKHLKSWLNLGIAKAMAKNPPDVKGGEAAWQKVIELAPGSEEAKKAQQGIDALKGGNHGKGTGGL